ncbi:rhodanese-related sulfurtransferase [Streptomyces sp. Amel2xB2]|uniref:rhodanese-like domain-containing protein n=1 Tax=Streptomyces sp. Amel2xB2 TaxID=1305829 RepID=UPI000DB95F62|nr:rhodanese-like domain-containing protein [Streptomyces sp. Amel2xB2]RAJ55455.1 rhodanese-related sulfurtransferase [Streptomyces sp. Amel2xB2]
MTGTPQPADGTEPSGNGAGPAAAAPSRVDSLLEEARSGLVRLAPEEAAHAQREEGALLVDIRYAELRERDGTIPGALIVERNELEWRLDPTCPHRSPEATGLGLHVVVVCNEGYASGLAARSLRDLGLHRATDLDGGFQAWRSAGLPVVPPVGAPAPLRAEARPTLET